MKYKTIIKTLRDCNILVVSKSDLVVNSLLGIFHENYINHIDHVQSIERIKSVKRPLSIDIMIVDIDEDPISILNFIKDIRQSKASFDPFIPICAIQSNADIHLINSEQKVGVDFSILMPFSLWDLLSHLNHIMRHRRRFIISNDFIGPYRGELKKRFKSNLYQKRLVPNRLKLRKHKKVIIDDIEDWKNEWANMVLNCNDLDQF